MCVCVCVCVESTQCAIVSEQSDSFSESARLHVSLQRTVSTKRSTTSHNFFFSKYLCSFIEDMLRVMRVKVTSNHNNVLSVE